MNRQTLRLIMFLLMVSAFILITAHWFWGHHGIPIGLGLSLLLFLLFFPMLVPKWRQRKLERKRAVIRERLRHVDMRDMMETEDDTAGTDEETLPPYDTDMEPQAPSAS